MLATVSSLLAITLAAQGAQPPADLSPSEKLYGLSLFWKEASDHFCYFDKVPMLDWDRAYRDFIPKVLATTSTYDYYRQLNLFAALLKDSHTDISFPPNVTGGKGSITPGVGALTIAGRTFVGGIPRNMSQEIPLRSEIVAVEGRPTQQYFDETWLWRFTGTDRQIRNSRSWLLLAKPIGETIHFTLVTPAGERKEVSALCTRDVEITVRDMNGGERHLLPEKDSKGAIAFDSLPAPNAVSFEKYSSVQHKDLGEGIHYVRLNTFADPKAGDEFEKLVPELSKAKGLIIDMRYNGGGNDAIGIQIARNFTRGKFRTFASKTRKIYSAFKAWGKSVDPNSPNLSDWEKETLQHFRGQAWESFPSREIRGHQDAKLLMPKVVLIGPSTASAAEDSLIYYDYIPNITTVGENTFGGTGQPLIFDLPGGGSARVCTQRCTYPDGREFVGPGIAPKVRIEPAPNDVMDGRDVVFEKGMEVLKQQIGRRGRRG